MKLIALALGTILLLSACNTVQGIGQDVRGAGNAISKTAESTKREMSR